MTAPASDGKFVRVEDIASRFEGKFPSSREEWAIRRIKDVEGELMYQVPSLRKTLADINAESEALGDPDRVGRVVTLVAEKVLDIYRNPGGPTTQHSVTTPDVTTSRTWAADPTRGRVQFTADELSKVRLQKRRSSLGTITIEPGFITR